MNALPYHTTCLLGRSTGRSSGLEFTFDLLGTVAERVGSQERRERDKKRGNCASIIDDVCYMHAMCHVHAIRPAKCNLFLRM